MLQSMIERFKRNSIRNKILILILITALCLLLSVRLINTYSKRLFTQQVVDSDAHTLSLHVQYLNEDLSTTSAFLSSFLLNETNYSGYLDCQTSQETYEASQNLIAALSDHLADNTKISGLFFCLKGSDDFLMLNQNYETYAQRESIKIQAKKLINEVIYTNLPELMEWTPINVHGTPFLIQIAHYKNVFIGAWCTNHFIYDPLADLTHSKEGSLFLQFTENGHELLLPLDEERNLPDAQYLTKETLEASAYSATGNFTIKLFYPNHSITRDVDRMNRYLIIFALVFLGLLIFVFQSIWSQFLIPILNLTDGMKKLKTGDWNTKLPLNQSSSEFTILTETFNEMSTEIHDLKIKIYEEKLQKAHAELQYLSLQIKPHFFLNSLSVIHSLAMTKQYAAIMEMASCLIHYFRYAFKVSDSLVYISEEIEHIQNYLRIQELRYSSTFHVELIIEDDLDAMLIPILTIHTFVENAIKHAFKDQEYKELRIHIYLKEATLCIDIKDNGQGFPAEMLDYINAPSSSDDVYGMKHIGIANVKHRLDIIYHEQAKLHFYNSNHGACVHLELPVKEITQ